MSFNMFNLQPVVMPAFSGSTAMPLTPNPKLDIDRYDIKVTLQEVPIVFHIYDSKTNSEIISATTNITDPDTLFKKIKGDTSIFAFRIDTAKEIKFDALIKNLNKKFSYSVNFFSEFKVQSVYHFCFPDRVADVFNTEITGNAFMQQAGFKRFPKLMTILEKAVEFNAAPAGASECPIPGWTKAHGGYAYKGRLAIVKHQFHGWPIFERKDLGDDFFALKGACVEYTKAVFRNARSQLQDQQRFRLGM